MAIDRREWKKGVLEAKVHKDCSDWEGLEYYYYYYYYYYY
jgi:hypothetical protein